MLQQPSWLSPTSLPSLSGSRLQPSDQAGKKKNIVSPGGPGTFPLCQPNDISVLKTSLLFHIYTQDTTHLLPEDTLHFQKCASTIYFLFFLAYGPTPKSITNTPHKSGVKHSTCLQATSPDLI